MALASPQHIDASHHHNLDVFVNTLMWADYYEDRAPVWCDICKYLLCDFIADKVSKSLVQRNLVRHAGLFALPNAQAGISGIDPTHDVVGQGA